MKLLSWKTGVIVCLLVLGGVIIVQKRMTHGHRNYYRVIKLYNHLEDEAQVAADYQLRLPDMSAILAEEGLTKVAAQEMTLILCSRAKYDKVVDQLWAHHRESTISEDYKTRTARSGRRPSAGD